MVTINEVREYMALPPDAPDAIAQLCLDAAKSKARVAGIPDYKNNAQYDMFLCALAACYYDNRGLAFSGTWSAAAQENAQRMVDALCWNCETRVRTMAKAQTLAS